MKVLIETGLYFFSGIRLKRTESLWDFLKATLGKTEMAWDIWDSFFTHVWNCPGTIKMCPDWTETVRDE